MQTIHSRTYTNVALTVLIVLMLLVLARPYLGLPSAHALERTDDSDDNNRTRISTLLEPNQAMVAAIRDVARSKEQIAAAVQETAKAQQNVADAIKSLGNPAR